MLRYVVLKGIAIPPKKRHLNVDADSGTDRRYSGVFEECLIEVKR